MHGKQCGNSCAQAKLSIWRVSVVQILPEGGVVEIELCGARDGCAGFEIRDNGPGMTIDVRARAFEPFFTRRPGGAGLGLTFVQRVIQEHRGRIVLESEPGEGTLFRVILPAAENST